MLYVLVGLYRIRNRQKAAASLPTATIRASSSLNLGTVNLIRSQATPPGRRVDISYGGRGDRLPRRCRPACAAVAAVDTYSAGGNPNPNGES